MPRFRFKIFDADKGKSRAGWLSAPTREGAREYLRRSGYKVESVEPAESAGPERPRLGLRASRARPYEVDFDPGHYRATWIDYWLDHRPPDAVIKVLLGLCFVLGFVTAAVGWWRSRPTITPAHADVGYRVSVAGQLVDAGAGHLDPASVTLRLRFPQVPFRKSWTGAGLRMDGQGRFRRDVGFQTACRVTYCRVRILQRGHGTVYSKRLQVTPDHTYLRLGRIAFTGS